MALVSFSIMKSRLQQFPLTADINKRGHLTIDGCDVVELAAEYGTPLYIFDDYSIRKKCREYKEQFGKRYENTTVCYAGKAFVNRAFVRILKEEDMGLDVVSGGELAVAKAADFPMDKVYFHGNNKSIDELKQALRNYVGRIVVDNYQELLTLSRLAEEMGHIPNILLRITPGVDSHTHAHITTGKMDSKFGIPLFEASDVMGKAMSMASIGLLGFHFHIGSQIFEAQPYEEAIDLLLEFSAQMRDRYGFELEELDIGGGYAIQYEADTPAPQTPEFASAVTKRITEKSKELGLELPTLVIEPGRSIAGPAGVAVYTVGNIKDIPEIRRYVAVDGGMTDNIRPAIYDAKYEAVLANKMLDKPQEKVTVAGKACESGDILIRDAYLPSIVTGDIIAIPDCGAYCLPMASNYNGALKPAVVMIKDGFARLIRRRETYEDLMANDLD